MTMRYKIRVVCRSRLQRSSATDTIAVDFRHRSSAESRGSRCRRTGMAPELPGSRRTFHQPRGENLMRRASTCLVLLGLAVLNAPSIASAAPTVTLKAKAVPLPGFPHTGDILGAGAAEQAEFTIKGTEYGG